MALPRYEPERLQEIALALSLNVELIERIYAGEAVATPAVAYRIHGVDPRTRLQDLRPNDWEIVWPILRLYGEA